MSRVKPLIYWPGLRPATLVAKNVVAKYGEDLVFVASPSSFDPTFIAPQLSVFEQQLGHSVVWLDKASDIWDRREEFNDRNLIIHSGWDCPEWLRFDKYMKRNGAKIVVSVDNNFKGNFRQYIGSIYFRLFLKKIFDASWSPGVSGQKLMRYFGVPANRTYAGLLGSDDDFFYFDKSVKKKQEFLFVGRLTKEKGVHLLVLAFKKYKRSGGKFGLRVMGSGELGKEAGDSIFFEGFANPEVIAQKMRESYCLVLPSLGDHWPTVLHEAMSCGCLIIPSVHCGNYHDLLIEGKNGFLLKTLTVDEIASKLFHVERLSSSSYQEGVGISIDISKEYGKKSYEKTFDAIVADLVPPSKTT